jgi:uncharacterized protein
MPSNFVGPPVRGTDCFGRDSFVDLVWEKLSFGHVILAAPRRFGKTSVMYRLIDAPRWDYKLVHCDLEHFIEPADLLTALIVQFSKDNALSRIVSALSYVPKKAWTGFRSNIEEIEVHQLKIKLKEQIRPKWQESGEELFEAIAATNHTVVFILDEFAVMIDRMARSTEHREEAKTMLRWLRHLRQSPRTQNVRFLIAGSIGIAHVLNQLGENTSINDFEQLKLQPFTTAVADRFLGELASSHKVPLSPAVRKSVLRLIGTPVPYFLQIMFSEICKAHKQGGATPTTAYLRTLYRETILGVDCKSYFDHYYGRLRDYYDRDQERAAKVLLRQLAVQSSLNRESAYSIYRENVNGADIESFNGLMANLENDFYISTDTRRSAYQFSCKLLRDWWLRHYGMEV